MYTPLHLIARNIHRYSLHPSLIVDSGFGQHSSKPVLADKTQQYIHFVKLQTYAEPFMMVVFKNPVKRVSGLKAFGRQCQLIARQFVKRHLRIFSQRMHVADNDCDIILKQRMRHDVLDRHIGLESKSKVDLAFAQHLHQFGHRTIKYV